jgi:hypothetical protein
VKKIGDKKWAFMCMVMVIILSLAIINCVVVRMQNNTLKKEAVSHMNAEWYQLNRLSELVDKNYIKNNFVEGVKYQVYVNQVCNHFTLAVTPSELTVNIRHLLIEAYDPLFTDLSLEKSTLNKEKASEILKGMNDSLLLVSKGIIDMQDHEKEKLLEPTSSEYITVNTQVKNMADKYTKLVDDYFRNNKK